jgi:Na+-translocating ferredoxin:NAD+ oxidoreductase RnfA subunit
MEAASKVSARGYNLKNLTLSGGISGLLSVTSYIVIAFISLPNQVTFLLAMLFPILGIIHLFAIKEFINRQNPSYFNDLGFVFGSFAFTICAIFLAAQLAVQSEMDFSIIKENVATLKVIKESIRLIDMGMDVAWDMFIGTFLVLFLGATQKVAALRFWGWALGIMGLALIVLNVMTFPIPPAESGLFDLGPFIALTLFGLAGQVLRLGILMEQDQ